VAAGDAAENVEISVSAAGPRRCLRTRGIHGLAGRLGGERAERPQFDDVAA
jgi:hypothetical protein